MSVAISAEEWFDGRADAYRAGGDAYMFVEL
jgi:hypothetical protein